MQWHKSLGPLKARLWSSGRSCRQEEHTHTGSPGVLHLNCHPSLPFSTLLMVPGFEWSVKTIEKLIFTGSHFPLHVCGWMVCSCVRTRSGMTQSGAFLNCFPLSPNLELTMSATLDPLSIPSTEIPGMRNQTQLFMGTLETMRLFSCLHDKTFTHCTIVPTSGDTFEEASFSPYQHEVLSLRPSSTTFVLAPESAPCG